MSDWSHGYDVSTAYSFGFFREMGPDWLDFCAEVAGFEGARRSGNFRYLELGSGQGFGLCLLAAANPQAEFVGVDFQPEHIEHSTALAEAAGLTNVRFERADFLELAADWPDDYGQFDYVTMHGIFSWVSEELRAAVLRCLVHGTRAGGLVYVSYNAQPGWLSAAPIRHFLRQAGRTGGRPPAIAAKESVALLSRLAAADAPIFKALPALRPKIEAMETREENYLVHEYMGEHWNPFWHSQVREEFGSAGFEYVGSATLADNLIQEFLPQKLYDAVIEQDDEVLREDLQDLILNQAFRRDIYCMGPRQAANGFPPARPISLHDVAAPAPGAPVSFETSFGQVSWDAAVFAGFLKELASGPKPLRQIFAVPSATAWQPRHIVLLMLHANMIGLGAAHPGSAAAAEQMNRIVARKVCEGATYRFLAAASLGSAIGAGESDLLLLDAWFDDSGRVAEGLSTRLERLGRPFDADINRAASAFIEWTLPRWRQLGVVR